MYQVSMTEIDGKLWAAFELFAAKYPNDPGTRMTLELARWVREHQALLESHTGTPPAGSCR
jgi:hypothetical protein